MHNIYKSVVVNKHYAKISKTEIRIPHNDGSSTLKGMEDQFKIIKPSKPPGPDDIFQQMLKNIIPSIMYPKQNGLMHR